MMAMVNSDEEIKVGGCLSEADIMKIGRGIHEDIESNLELSPQECSDMLNSLASEGWLIQNPNKPGCYSLGVDALSFRF